MAIIRVTLTEDYLVDMADDKRTEINGWTIEEVIENWFKNYPLDRYRASREAFKIGNSRKLIKTEVID